MLEVAYDDLPAAGDDPKAYSVDDYARVIDSRLPGPHGFVGHWTGHYLLSSSDCQMFVMQVPETSPVRSALEVAPQKNASSQQGAAVPVFSRVRACAYRV